MKLCALHRLHRLLLPAILALAPAVAQAQTITVSGRVVEQGSGDPIPAASVQLGNRTVLTNPNGGFVFTGVSRGQQRLSVSSIGYSRFEQNLNLRRDTTLLVTLEVEAVRVDSLTVRAATFSVRGVVSEAETGQPIMDAEIVTDKARSARSDGIGRYRVRGLPRGSRVVVAARSLGRMPVQVVIESGVDTTIHFGLPLDPVAQRMIDNQIARLQERLDAYPYGSTTVARDSLMKRFYNWTAADIVTNGMLAARRGAVCMMLDDRQLMYGVEELNGYLPDQIERIEIVDRGRMIRVYTRNYIQNMLRGRVTLPAITLREGMGRALCQ